MRSRYIRSSGFILPLVAVGMAIVVAVITGIVFNISEQSKRNRLEEEAAALFGLKAKIIEFAAQTKRLPTVTEYQDVISKGSTDRLSRTPIYLVADNLDSTGDICTETSSPMTLYDCAADTSCATPRITTAVPFVLLVAGDNVANTSSIVNQTTSATQSAVITGATTLTTFTPGIEVGSLADRTADVSRYDDQLVAGTFTELRIAAQCNSANQGDVASKGVSVRILNTPGALLDATIGVPYTAPTTSFLAYGSSLATYAWSSSTLPAGLALVAVGNTSQITGTPTIGGTYNITISVTATIANVNTASHSVAMTLVVCPYANSTGTTRTLSCGGGYTGAISEYEVQTCTGAFAWIESGRTCTPIPLPSEVNLTSAALAAAGADTSGRNLNVPSLTVSGVTITAGDNSPTPITKHLSRNSTGTGIGVVNVGGTDYPLSGTEALEFSFGSGLGAGASVVFSSLGRTSGGQSPIYDQARITFYSGATIVGTLTKTACDVNNDQNNTLVAFNNLDPGGTFDRFVITSVRGDFFVATVESCTGVTCATSTTPTATCP